MEPGEHGTVWERHAEAAREGDRRLRLALVVGSIVAIAILFVAGAVAAWVILHPAPPARSELVQPETVGVIAKVEPNAQGSYNTTLADGTSLIVGREQAWATTPMAEGFLMLAGTRRGEQWVLIVPSKGDVFSLAGHGWDAGDRVHLASVERIWLDLPKAPGFETAVVPADGHYISPTGRFHLDERGQVVGFRY